MKYPTNYIDKEFLVNDRDLLVLMKNKDNEDFARIVQNKKFFITSIVPFRKHFKRFYNVSVYSIDNGLATSASVVLNKQELAMINEFIEIYSDYYVARYETLESSRNYKSEFESLPDDIFFQSYYFEILKTVRDDVIFSIDNKRVRMPSTAFKFFFEQRTPRVVNKLTEFPIGKYKEVDFKDFEEGFYIASIGSNPEHLIINTVTSSKPFYLSGITERNRLESAPVFECNMQFMKDKIESFNISISESTAYSLKKVNFVK